MEVQDAGKGILELVMGVDKIGDASQNFTISDGSIIEARRVNEMHFIDEVGAAQRNIDNVILNFVGHYSDISPRRPKGLIYYAVCLPLSRSPGSPIGIVLSSVTTDIKVLLPAPVRPMTKM